MSEVYLEVACRLWQQVARVLEFFMFCTHCFAIVLHPLFMFFSLFSFPFFSIRKRKEREEEKNGRDGS